MGVHLLNPPLNFKPKDRHAFQHEGFGFPELSLANLEAVVITDKGICLDNQQIVRESIHHHRDKMELYHLMVADIKSDEIIRLNDSQKYLIIHGPVQNIYHWITESIPRLWMVKDDVDQLTLLLPAEMRGTVFDGMLAPFGLKKIQYLSPSKNVFVNHLVLPELKPLFSIFDPALVIQIREFYFNWLQRNFLIKNSEGKQLYLKSTGNNANVIHNNVEMETMLENMGFEIVDVAKHNFPEWIQKLVHADFVISLDSHELACMQFMRPGTSVLELKFDHGNDVDLYKGRFWHLASCLDLNYYYQFGDHTSYAADHFTKCFTFDLKLLQRNIVKILRRDELHR
jgi:capsular polysaccharide biosynthesis protein